MKGLILVDGNSIGYAAHSVKELTNNGQQVQAIFYSLSMIKKAIEKFPECQDVVVLWDTKAKFRFDLYPEYKGKRDDSPEKKASREAYKSQVPLIRKAYALLGIEQRVSAGYEADDLAGAIVQSEHGYDQIVMVTGDKDWLQLSRPGVMWYDPREDGKLVGPGGFQQFTGCHNPNVFLQVKALLGDSSDNIKGVAGVGDKCIEHLTNYFGSPMKFLAWAEQHYGKSYRMFEKGELPDELNRWKGKLADFVWGDQKEVFKRNMKLMNLMTPAHRSGEILTKSSSVKSKYDHEGFIEFCHTHAFFSIIKRIGFWQKTFAN